MKRLFAATALALTLISGTVTTAQADNRDRNRNERGHDSHHDNRRDDSRRDDRHDDRHNDRHNDRHDDRHNDRHNDRHDDRHNDRHDDRHDNWHNERHDDRHYDHRDDRRYDRRDWDSNYGFRHYDGRRYDYGRYVRPSSYSYRSWRYGDHLPRGYYSSRYVVNDYHVYRLRPPPRGYQYVRVDHDVVLAAIASGIVVSAVFGIFN